MKTKIMVIAVPFLLLFSAYLFAGIQNSRDPGTRCFEPMARGEYIFPAYRLGCYLGEVPK